MSETEKIRTIAAVMNAANNLLESAGSVAREALATYNTAGFIKYFTLQRRAIRATEGYYGTRTEKAVERWLLVREEAIAIANETGAEFQDVFDLMRKELSEFVAEIDG